MLRGMNGAERLRHVCCSTIPRVKRMQGLCERATRASERCAFREAYDELGVQLAT